MFGQAELYVSVISSVKKCAVCLTSSNLPVQRMKSCTKTDFLIELDVSQCRIAF